MRFVSIGNGDTKMEKEIARSAIKEKEIKVVLSPHALQRFRERMNTNLSNEKIIDALNYSFNKGLVKALENENGAFLLGFEGENFYFIIKKEKEDVYVAKTFEWKLVYEYPKVAVKVRYL